MTVAVSVLQRTSRLGGLVPGWFPLVADPVFRRVTSGSKDTEASGSKDTEASLFGFSVDLDLADYVQRKTFLQSFERREMRFLGRWLRPGDGAVDVGANVGILTLAMAASVGATGHVVAIEPVPCNVERLSRWCRRNHLDMVDIIGAAASDHAGLVSLGTPDLGISSESTGHYSIAHSRNQISAAAIVLDDLQAVRDLGRIRLVKIDVEGMEIRVLRGCRRLLEERAIDALMVEFNPTHSDAGEMLDFLTDVGYLVRHLAPLGKAGRALHPKSNSVTPWNSMLARNLVAFAPHALP